MNYEKLHNTIIQHARLNPPVGYSETHHIIPECMGGTDDNNNLIKLTARYHFVIHRILTKIYPKNSKIWYAYNMMFKYSKKSQRTKDIGWVKSTSVSHTYAYLKTNRPKHSQESKNKIAKARLGKKLSKETKLKISISKSGIKLSETTKKKMSLCRFGKVQSTKTKLKRRLSSVGINSKKWQIIDPNGNTHNITNLKEFCKQNNLDNSALSNTASGKRNQHKGYKAISL